MQGRFKDVSRTFLGRSKDIPRAFQGRSGTFQGRLGTFQGRFKDVSRTFQERFKDVSRTFRDVGRVVALFGSLTALSCTRPHASLCRPRDVVEVVWTAAGGGPAGRERRRGWERSAGVERVQL
eukprot:6200551-Pleurochrysis_carterae.AAC.1